jgi:hypothetical protein
LRERIADAILKLEDQIKRSDNDAEIKKAEEVVKEAKLAAAGNK